MTFKAWPERMWGYFEAVFSHLCEYSHILLQKYQCGRLQDAAPAPLALSHHIIIFKWKILNSETYLDPRFQTRDRGPLVVSRPPPQQPHCAWMNGPQSLPRRGSECWAGHVSGVCQRQPVVPGALGMALNFHGLGMLKEASQRGALGACKREPTLSQRSEEASLPVLCPDWGWRRMSRRGAGEEAADMWNGERKVLVRGEEVRENRLLPGNWRRKPADRWWEGRGWVPGLSHRMPRVWSLRGDSPALRLLAQRCYE